MPSRLDLAGLGEAAEMAPTRADRIPRNAVCPADHHKDVLGAFHHGHERVVASLVDPRRPPGRSGVAVRYSGASARSGAARRYAAGPAGRWPLARPLREKPCPARARASHGLIHTRASPMVWVLLLPRLRRCVGGPFEPAVARDRRSRPTSTRCAAPRPRDHRDSGSRIDAPSPVKWFPRTAW